jgi:hypothetical protein
MDHGPGTMDRGPWTGDQGPGTRDQGPWRRETPGREGGKQGVTTRVAGTGYRRSDTGKGMAVAVETDTETKHEGGCFDGREPGGRRVAWGEVAIVQCFLLSSGVCWIHESCLIKQFTL